ncbi:hypothetical protein P4544_01630 [Halomonas sp. LY9]
MTSSNEAGQKWPSPRVASRVSSVASISSDTATLAAHNQGHSKLPMARVPSGRDSQRISGYPLGADSVAAGAGVPPRLGY